MQDSTLSEVNQVLRRGEQVLRPVGPWTASTQSLLQHFAAQGLPVPQVLPSPDPAHEALSYLEGEQVHPHAWTDEGLYAIGQLVRALHDASETYTPPEGAVWKPWCLREIGAPGVYSHGDIAPWNIITRDGLPIGLIDWEYAGPIDPMVELARVCWLFPQLHDDDIGKMYSLPTPKKRAQQVGLMLDAYGLTRAQRAAFIEVMIETVICETAHEAIDAHITPESTGSLWGMAWRTRSLYWIWRHRCELQGAVE